MAELLTAATGLLAIGIAVFMLMDSDDDNGGGGLMEPTLAPIPVRSPRH